LICSIPAVFREHLTAKGSANTVQRNQKLFNGEQRLVIAAIIINLENIFLFSTNSPVLQNQMKDERSLTGESNGLTSFLRCHRHFPTCFMFELSPSPHTKNGGALKFKVFVGSQ
jgi:hypothetical protein